MRTQTRIRCLMAFCCSIVVAWPLAPAFAQALTSEKTHSEVPNATNSGRETLRTEIAEHASSEAGVAGNVQKTGIGTASGENSKPSIQESTANYEYSSGMKGVVISEKTYEKVSDATKSANTATAVSVVQGWDPSKVKRLEDVNIMARLIDKILSKELGGDYCAQTLLSEGCRGFYVPGMGAIFTLRVEFPVRLGEIRGVDMTPLDELDPWEQERLRLQTGTTISHGVAVTTVLRRGEAVALSKEEFEELKKRISILKQNLISILGTYGRRLSGLSAQERIAFVVFGRGGRTRAVVGSMSMPSSVPLFAEDEDKVRGDLERARLDMQKAADEMRTLRKMPWLSEGTGDSDTTLVFSALVSGLPQTPPAETTESADWVEVIAY